MADRYVLRFSEIDLDMLPLVGGKNASLGEMIRELGAAGVRVPHGFALTTAAWDAHLAAAGIGDEIHESLDRLDVGDVEALSRVARAIRERIAGAPLPEDVAVAARAAYAELSALYQEEETDVAVRSSATAEDLPTASFAGQQETYLNVRGWRALERAIRDCMASLFTDRAVAYRVHHGIGHRRIALSVGVQKMVRSDLGSAGVLFTLDPESGFRDVVFINGAWGLGELVVQGRVVPDEYVVHKPTLRQGFRSLVRREIGEKATKLIYAPADDLRVREVEVDPDDRRRPVLTEAEALQLARWAIAVEDHYSARARRPMPMDLEWAKDGVSGDLFVLQARPETVHSQKARPTIEIYELRGRGDVLVTGRSVGARVGAGPVRVVESVDRLGEFRDGEVLVARMTDPDWEPVLRKAAAVVTDQGGRTCHAAIVSRELGIPCIVGTGDATRVLENGREVTISCAEGETGHVYDGRVPYERHEIDPETLPKPPVPLMLNLADPETAFGLAQLPSAGVGLLRIEFLVSNWIGVHPMALIHPDRIDDPDERRAVLERARGHREPGDFFVERMASGVATIAAAFYPRPVIVRFSDFKSNEYARLLGGRSFEPVEANPMIGWRGASRYYHDRYREGFALECRAIHRVREVMGLTNVRVMVPFCRTVEEGRRVLDEMARNGLHRGEDGLEVYLMCEIPNNVVLAEDFARHFDGFSIGSNDLTQLVLGVDRDSDLLAPVFDERDPGVTEMIRRVIETTRRTGTRIGICGQAPSDHPDYATFLARLGIDSISLTPDALPRVARELADALPTPGPAGAHAEATPRR